VKTDITMYGHLMIDRVYDTQTKTSLLGGVANCWRSLSIIDPTISINIHPLSIGESLIYIDKYSNERICNSVMNKYDFDFKHYDSNMYHIAYINDLKDISFLKNLNGIIFADCSSMDFDFNLIKLVDYFFISDDDAKYDVKFYGNLAKKGAILHSPNGSLFSDGKIIEKFTVPKELYLLNVNILGAGDMFAASFIYGIYKQNTVENAIKNAHVLTSNLIKKQNENIIFNSNNPLLKKENK